MTEEFLPDQSKSSHAHWLQVGVPAYISKMGTKKIAAMAVRRVIYLLVISKVVPKIWARTNSAILENKQGTGDAQCE